MSTSRFTPKAYLKDGCPYSFKFLLFMAEARLLDRIQVVRCQPEGADFERIKNELEAASGKPATFPTVEVEPGRYISDSDRLVDHYARANDTSPRELPAFSFYVETIFPQLDELHSQHA